jgi:hypothetical protein
MKNPNLPPDFILIASKFYLDDLGDFKRGSPLLNYLQNDYGSFSDEQQIKVKENFEFWDGDTLQLAIFTLSQKLEEMYVLGQKSIKPDKNEKKK